MTKEEKILLEESEKRVKQLDEYVVKLSKNVKAIFKELNMIL